MNGFQTGTQNDAVKADSSGYVNVPGAYIGIIKEAEMKTFESGAKSLLVVIETEAGMIKDMINTNKKDGSNNDMGLNKIQGGLMRCIGLAEGQGVEFQSVQVGTETKVLVPDFIGKRVGACINIEKTGTPAKTYTNTEVANYYNADTLKTGSGKDVNDIVPTLKVIDSVMQAPTPGATTGVGTTAPTNPFNK